jgi:hypothetical protein
MKLENTYTVQFEYPATDCYFFDFFKFEAQLKSDVETHPHQVRRIKLHSNSKWWTWEFNDDEKTYWLAWDPNICETIEVAYQDFLEKEKLK